MNKVFVYGTLKRGNSNSSLMHNQTYVGDGKTKNKYVMYATAIPFVVEDKLAWQGDEATHIYGELWMVNNQVLKELDALEGHPYLYRRTTTDINMEDGSMESAFMYLYGSHPYGQHIPSGVFVDRFRKARPATGQQQETTTRTNY